MKRRLLSAEKRLKIEKSFLSLVELCLEDTDLTDSKLAEYQMKRAICLARIDEIKDEMEGK